MDLGGVLMWTSGACYGGPCQGGLWGRAVVDLGGVLWWTLGACYGGPWGRAMVDLGGVLRWTLGACEFILICVYFGSLGL